MQASRRMDDGRPSGLAAWLASLARALRGRGARRVSDMAVEHGRRAASRTRIVDAEFTPVSTPPATSPPPR